ncbi:ABC transporter permease [Paenibacillus macquariensis subsp. macquariensis]|uniref:ABC-2 type transport system permease protein n=1 Tax=Paenibacillus macquariensis TaxID=948756 RepID=A0ABY1JQW7_9BACL|nr:ABC transporter permease [Paenibacillus macquariensis]MEC0092647.1 ABC transporter permease [Paenibacillus macquariensis]OAB36586.1 ABC transporter permease [Paenibacillus macquariensis subsp. macquariensis]SIQ62963.1 ABC-2 type transport system permease protein [Paenibacillus macquariensis]
MANFYKLVLNENMKIYRRARTWIMLSILAIVSILMPFVFFMAGSQENPSVWEVVLLTMTFTFFMNIIFASVIAADSVASEFSWGTIKLLLIRPWSRSKILLSKYISVILFGILSTLMMFGVTFLFANIWFTYDVGSTGLISSSWSAMSYTLMILGCKYVELILITTIAFMISTLFRSSTFAIVLSLVVLFSKDIFLLLLNPDKYVWMKYVIFTQMDLKGYIDSPVGPGGSTLAFSLIVLAIYYICFLVLTWVIFNKRDVAT